MDKIELKGELELKIYNKGKLIKTDIDHNLITNLGENAALKLLSGVSGYGISKVQIGTNSTIPKKSDTTIISPINLAITSKTITDRGLELKFQIGSLVGNGTTISEFGLITEANTLFSRRVVTPIDKIQDLSIECNWIIKI